MALLVASLLLAALAPVMTKRMDEAGINISGVGSGVRSDYSREFYEDFEWTVPGGVNLINITAVGGGGAGGGASYGYKEITSSESNWIVPEGVTKLRVFMTGAGGGGASGGRGNTWVTVNGEDTHQDFLTPGESTFSKIVPELDANCKASGSVNWISTTDNSKIYSPGSSYLNSVKVTACGGGGGSGGADPVQGNSGGGGSGGFLSNKIVEFNTTTLYIKIPHGGGAGADCGNTENATWGGYYSGGGGGGAGRTNTGGASSYQFGGYGGSGFYTLTSNETKNAYDGANGDSYLSSLAGGGSVNYGYYVLTSSDKKYEFYSGAGGNGGIWGGGGGGGGRSAYYVCGGGGGGGGGPTTITTQSGNNENSIIFQIGGGGGGGGGGSIGKSSNGVTTSYGAGGAGGAGGGYGAGGGAGGGGRQGNVLSSKGAGFKTTNIGGGNGKTGIQSQLQNAGGGGSGYGGGASSYCGASTIDSAIAIFGENHCSGGAGKCSSTTTMSRGENGKPGALRLEYSYPAIKCQRNVPANGGAGGGAGQVWIGEINVTPGQKINFNVGLGGNTQTVPGKNGNDGTQTSIVINGSTIASASGGKGGKYESDDTYIANSGGLGGGLKNENFKNWTGIEGILGGQTGKPGNTVANGAGGGAGGTTFKKDGTMINGGASAGAQSNGADAPSTNYGTGGGGGGGVIANNMIPGFGGKGANGYIYIEWGNANGGGGATGQVAVKKSVWVSAGTKIKINVGKGGEGKPVLNTLNGVSGYFGQDGNDGGDTYVTTSEGEAIRAKGGLGGKCGRTDHGRGGNYYEVDSDGNPVSGSSYMKNSIKGEDGSDDYGGIGGSITETLCPLITSLNGLGGCGGNMPNGNCANSSSTAIGKNASKIGGGGGGGAVKDNAAYQGGRGANGMVVIEWSN